MALIQVTQAAGDGSSVALLTGRPMLDDGDLQYPDDDTILTTIAADAGMASAIAEHLERFFAGDEPDLPVASFEPWAVLG